MARSIFGTANNFISSSSKYNTIVFYKIVHATSSERGIGKPRLHCQGQWEARPRFGIISQKLF